MTAFVIGNHFVPDDQRFPLLASKQMKDFAARIAFLAKTINLIEQFSFVVGFRPARCTGRFGPRLPAPDSRRPLWTTWASHRGIFRRAAPRWTILFAGTSAFAFRFCKLIKLRDSASD